MIPKSKHDSRSKGLSCPVKALMDGPRARGGRSARTGQTVHDPRMDGLLNATGPRAAHPETQTVRTLHPDCLRATRTARTVRGLCADGPPNPSSQKLLAKRIETKTLKNTRRTRRTPGQKAPRGLSTTYKWTVHQARTEQPELQTASTTSPTEGPIRRTREGGGVNGSR
jgi:hypothetical protein